MRGYYSNLLHSSYYGCCMGAKKDFLMRYCSFIDDNTPFDQFFGLMAEKEKKTAFINSVLITHRYHGFNQSKKLNIFQQIIFRYRLFLVTQRASRNN